MKQIDYDKQAADFLKSTGVKFSAVLSDTKDPLWSKNGVHGHHYRITLSRSGKRVSFDFWDSAARMQEGVTTVSPYNVLACISSDSSCPDTFEEFCSEFGYDQDSRQAEQTFKNLSKFSKKLKVFFTESELEALQEIR